MTSEFDWTSSALYALLGASAGGLGARRRDEGSPRDVRGFGSCERQCWRREPKEPRPCRLYPKKIPGTSSALHPKRGKIKPNALSRRKAPSGAANPKKAPSRLVVSKATKIGPVKTPAKAQEPGGERITKRERMLTLLSQPAGASIQEMMQATGWQQHSVRGFLAGTVKRKLGFSLTSSKPEVGVRRYRIETRRGR